MVKETNQMEKILKLLRAIIAKAGYCAHSNYGAIVHQPYLFWGKLVTPETRTCVDCGKTYKTNSEVSEIILGE